MSKQNQLFFLLLLSLGCAKVSSGTGSYEKSPPLEAQVAELSKTIEQTPNPTPEQVSEWGLLLLVSGQGQPAQKRLEAAVSQGQTDSLTMLGAALAAQEAGAVGLSHERLLAFLEQAVKREPTDPWSPAVAELATHRLLAQGPLGLGAAEDKLRQKRLAQLWEKRAQLPLEAQQFLGALLGQSLRLSGEESAARKVDVERGCPPTLYVSGPHGHFPQLDVRTPWPSDKPAADPSLASYKVRSGLGCSLQVQGLPSRPGVFSVHTFFRVSDERPVPLTVETGGTPWALHVDGERTFHDTAPVSRRYFSLRLSPGWHTVSVKLGVAGSNHVQVALPGVSFYEGEPRQAPRPAPGSVSLEERKLAPLPVAQTRVQGALRALLGMQQAYFSGDTDEGLALAEAHVSETPRFSALRTVYANLLLADPNRPDRLARDRARSQLKVALLHNPNLLTARLAYARLLLQDEKAALAQEVLDANPQEVAPIWQTELLRHRILKARGFLVEARAALDAAQKLGPSSCSLLDHVADFRREEQDDRGYLQAAQAFSSCNPYADRFAEALLSAGRLEEAQAEFERLRELEPENQAVLRGLVRVQVARKALGPAVATLLRLRELAPARSQHFLDLANLFVERNQPENALRELQTGLSELPDSPELAKANKAVTQKDVLDPYRLDGKDIVRAFEARRGVYSGESAVLVLDRTVMRVFPRGERLSLTHNIIRVLTKEGIDRYGEVHIPDGAEVLKLRTIKADGTIREPEEIPEKDTVSAPSLEVGDYVEYEYLDRDSSSAIAPNGFLGERFYFASADAPLDRSEYLLITPKNMPLQIDLRGPLNEKGNRTVPTVNKREEGDLSLLFWQRTQIARTQPEQPVDQGQVDDFTPSVRVGSGVMLSGYVNQFRERRYRSLRQNHELKELALKVGGSPDASPETPKSQFARAKALDAWVRKNIHSGGSFDEPASSILARREGRREVLLLALLATAGIPAETWLVRPENNPKLEGPLPDVLAYSEPLIAVAPDEQGQPLFFIDPVYRHSPTGLIRPLLRGAQALRVKNDPSLPKIDAVQQVTVPLSPTGGVPPRLLSALSSGTPGQSLLPMLSDRRKVEFFAELEATGAAQVRVRESLTGVLASEWRDQVEHVAEDKLRKMLEQRALGFYFPGASLASLNYGPLDREDDELVIEYRFSVPQLARQRVSQSGQKELVLPVPYPLLLGRRYVTVPQRKLPLLIGYVTPSTLEAHIALPKGARVVQLAEPVELQGFGRYNRSARAETDKVTLRVQTELLRKRILPDQYPAFVEFAARTDVAEEAFALIAVP